MNTPKIAIVEKGPSNNKYSKYFEFEFDQYQLCSQKLPKVLKKDVDIDIDLDKYDYVILVGSEASKHFAKVTSVTDMAGHLVDDKFIPIINPAMILFKPDTKPAFEKSLERLHKVISGVITSKPGGKTIGITNTTDALLFLDKVDMYAKETGVIALDSETSALYPTDGYVLGVSICASEIEGAYISTECMTKEVEDKLQYLFNKYKIVLHNAKFDLKFFQYHFNFKFPDFEDTLVIHYLLDETQGSHGLKSLALKYTDYGDYDSELDSFKKDYCRSHGILESEFSYDLIPFEVMVPYAVIDVFATLSIYNKFKPILEKNSKLLNLYNSLMIPAVRALIKIELAGVPFDKSRLEYAKVVLDKEINEATNHLYSLQEVLDFQKEQGKDFNPNSVLQLRKLLFDKLKLIPLNKKTGTGLQSTDAEVLEYLEGQHEVVNSIIKIRKLGKIMNTYVENLLANLDSDGRVRTGFNLTSTTSGRLSSSGKINAQQIPRDSPFIKGAIKGSGKYENWKIVSQDLQTGEVYYAAVLSGDKKLQQIFKDKQDFHSSIAKQVFSLPGAVEDVKKFFKDKRQAAKAVTFSILYGAGPQKVSDTVNKDSESYFSMEDAQEAISLYFRTFSRLKAWLKETETLIKQQGFIYTSFGRKRRLKNVHSPDKGIAAHELRSGINSVVQSICSDINLFAAIEMVQHIEKTGMQAEVVALVHDSVMAIVHPDAIEEYQRVLKEITQKDRGFSIPGCPIGVDSEVGVDYSFGKFDKEVGEAYLEFLNATK